MSVVVRLLAVAACAAVGAGCGTEDISPDTVANAANATREAGGSRVAMEIAMTTPDGQDFEFSGAGVMDMAGQRGRLTFDMSQLPGGEGEMEQVFDRYVLWMRAPAFEQGLPEGKEWVKIDMQRAWDELGIDMSQMPQAGNDPSKMLEYLRASGDVEDEGEEKVRGVAATHYSATTDLREYPELVPESERDAARETVERLIDLGGAAEFPVDVWIDDRDLIRRMRVELPMEIAGAGKLEMAIDYELYDFGIPVDVAPPPEGEVADITELAAEAARQQQAR
jgi:hypothetical protein